MSFKNLKRLLYGFSFFDDFILIYPLYAVLFVDKGLSAAQISSLLIVWSLTAFILEVPSGAVADKYSRKNVLMAAVFVRAIGFGCWLLAPNYLGFLVGFLFWGISTAFISGTLEAFVYDELKRLGQTKAYALVNGRMEAFGLAALTLSALLASSVANHGFTLILGFSIFAIVISTIIVALLPQAKAIKSTDESKYLSYLKDGVLLVFRKPKIMLIVGFTALVTGLDAADEYHELFMNQRGFSNGEIAFWVAFIYICAAIGSVLAHKLQKRKTSLTTLMLFWAVALFATALLPKTFVPLAIGLYSAVYYSLKILFNTYVQHAIDDRTRATTTSVSGFLVELVALVVFGIFALTANKYGYGLGLQIVAGMVVAAAVLYKLTEQYFDQDSKA